MYKCVHKYIYTKTDNKTFSSDESQVRKITVISIPAIENLLTSLHINMRQNHVYVCISNSYIRFGVITRNQKRKKKYIQTYSNVQP